MKVLFIYSLDDVQSISKPLRSWATIQFGVSYISSVLRSRGHETRLVVLGSSSRWAKSAPLIRDEIEHFAPGIICLTSVASQFPFIARVAQFIRSRWTNIFLVIGGVHATLNPDQVITGSFDALCIGEGEYPMMELCSQLESGDRPHGIANLWIRAKDGSFEKNAPRPYIKDIDDLPFPDREMWSPWIKEQVGADLSVLLGRGCPNDCSYCCNHAIRKVAPGDYVRLRSPESIVEELALLHREYPAHRRIFMEIESIALDKAWTLELCNRLESFNASIGTSLFYACNFRISRHSMDENIFEALKRANFYKINIGLESGSERIRREVLKRDYTDQDFMDVLAMARRHGLSAWVFNMIGLPGETWQDHMETVSLNRRCQPAGHYTGIFSPYPGTEIHDSCRREGIKLFLDPRMERRLAAIDFPNFSRKKIQNAYIWFTYRVYKGHRPFWWVLLQTVLTYVRSDERTNLLFRKIVQWPMLRRLRAKLVW